MSAGDMSAFLVRKAAQAILTMALATFLVFAVIEISPRDTARSILGPYATEEQVDLLRKKVQDGSNLGVRYIRWISMLVGLTSDPLEPFIGNRRGIETEPYFGNFGYSVLYAVPVEKILWDRLTNTALLATLAFLVIVPLSLALGIVAAAAEGSLFDRTTNWLLILFISVPEFASGVLLVTIFAVTLGWLPGASTMEGDLWSIPSQLVLPVLVIVLYGCGYVTRIVRSSMVEAMKQPYVFTAIAKGLPRRKVVRRHVVRNGLVVPVTVILLQLPWLLTGVVATEVIFAFPGVGRLLLEAALAGDVAVIQAVTIVALLVTVTTQAAGDLAHMMLDPRIRAR